MSLRNAFEYYYSLVFFVDLDFRWCISKPKLQTFCPRKQRTSLSAVCVPTGLLNYIKHWNARSSKKVFSKKAKYRLYDNFSPSNLYDYEKESFFIHYTLSSLFEKPCSEKCRLYSFLAKFVLNWITAATIYYEEEPGNSISMLKLERNTKIEKKKPHNSIF